MELNDIEQACDYAKKAHDIASRSYEIVDTYGYCLLKKGDTDKALELLEMAYRSRPNNAEIALHFAEVWFLSANILRQLRCSRS